MPQSIDNRGHDVWTKVLIEGGNMASLAGESSLMRIGSGGWIERAVFGIELVMLCRKGASQHWTSVVERSSDSH